MSNKQIDPGSTDTRSYNNLPLSRPTQSPAAPQQGSNQSNTGSSSTSNTHSTGSSSGSSNTNGQ